MRNHINHEPVVLGAVFNIRLEDLSADQRIRIICNSCGHEGFIDPVALLSHYQPYERLISIEQHFKCKCGARGGTSWRVVKIRLGSC